jgi:hypothetical protein
VAGGYGHIKKGRAEDLGPTYFNSAWERNVARWLNWRIALGELESWEYEPDTFHFSGVLRGAVCYTPDFRLRYPDGTAEFLEVKGYETSTDRTKWKRMAKHHPTVKLTILGRKEYRQLTQLYGGLPHWERENRRSGSGG